MRFDGLQNPPAILRPGAPTSTRTDGWAAVDLIRERGGGGSVLFSFVVFLLPTEIIRSKGYEEAFFSWPFCYLQRSDRRGMKFISQKKITPSRLCNAKGG